MASQRRGIPTFFVALAAIVLSLLVPSSAAIAQTALQNGVQSPNWEVLCPADGRPQCALPAPATGGDSGTFTVAGTYPATYNYTVTSRSTASDGRFLMQITTTLVSYGAGSCGGPCAGHSLNPYCGATNNRSGSGPLNFPGSPGPNNLQATWPANCVGTKLLRIGGYNADAPPTYAEIPYAQGSGCDGPGGFGYASVRGKPTPSDSQGTIANGKPFTYSVRTIGGVTQNGTGVVCDRLAYARAIGSAQVEFIEIRVESVLVYYWKVNGGLVIDGGTCVMSDLQLVLLARASGLPETQIRTSVAIALAESSGRVNAVNRNPSPVTYDIGLWQINDTAHPSYDRQLLGTNPFFNATAMKEIYTTAAAWTPWSSFNANRHTQFLGRADTAFTQSAGASSAITDCSGSTTTPDKDTNGDGVIDATDKTPVDYCKLSFNPLDYLKCLFVPTKSFEAWQELRQTAVSKPPVSIINGGYTFVNGIFSQYGECTNAQVGTGGCQQTYQGNVRLTGGLTSPEYRFNPFNQAGEAAAGSSVYQNILNIIRFGLWMGFGLYLFRRVGASFGSKQTGNDGV